MRSFWRSKAVVNNIAVDLENSTRLIFSTDQALQYTNGDTAEILVGNINLSGFQDGVGTAATFSSLKWFIQVNASHIIAVDTTNHCLRMVDRRIRSTMPFVGSCTNDGFANGYGLTALFNQPSEIIRSKESGWYLVADKENDAIREVHLLTRDVKTFYEHSTFKDPVSITFDPPKDILFVGGVNYIGQINTTNLTLKIHTRRSSFGNFDGSLENAKFSTINSMLALSSSVILAADTHNGRIRLVNMDNWNVSTFCPQTFSGNSALGEPISLLLTSERFFVADLHDIKVASGR